jgi:hypothetical protein
MQGHSMKIVQEIIAQFKGDMRRWNTYVVIV